MKIDSHIPPPILHRSMLDLQMSEIAKMKVNDSVFFECEDGDLIKLQSRVSVRFHYFRKNKAPAWKFIGRRQLSPDGIRVWRVK